jgi:hypothetical protein
VPVVAPATDSGCRAHPQLGRTAAWGFAAPALRAALLSLALADAAAAQSVLLFGASLDEARDFAVESAYARGWSIPEIGAAAVEFEQTLDEGDPEAPLMPRVLIRISAHFTEEATGTRVLLRAREVETAATGETWTADVTLRYAENLNNALSSLRNKWDARRERDSIGGMPTAADHLDLPAGAASVGTWAYYAERYAESRGCELTSSGAILEASGPEWERHRIDCRDGRSMRVQCRHGDCASDR